MSGVFQGLFGGGAPASQASGDADFADFAGAPEPQTVSPVLSPSGAPGQPQAAGAESNVPYTKWYRVWERTSPKDFKQEAFIFPFLLFIVLFHVWGAGKNRRKAKSWIQAHLGTLQSEFALVGYGGVPNTASPADTKGSDVEVPDNVLKEKAINEFETYATGRQNIAFMDVSIKLAKRYNPVFHFGETVFGLFFESVQPEGERVELSAYAFDGNEKELVPSIPGDPEQKVRSTNSTYDGFVFAVVHKSSMRQLRESRYDVSLTFTKDIPKLSDSFTVMSESAEITDNILTPELVKAVEEAGDLFEYLLITDQPKDKPTSLDETKPRKRVILSTRVPSSTSPSAYDSTQAIFQAFVRTPDRLVSIGHWRQEVLRKIRNTREEEIRKIKRASEDDKAEERKISAEKLKKEDRDRLLRTMSADEQKKYLEKERNREMKRDMKKQTRKG